MILVTAMWQNFKKRAKKLPPFLTNLYFLTAVVFGLWMLFGDDNNLLTQYRRYSELASLNAKKTFYVQQIEQTQKEYSELTSNPATQEKFAREHYYMKRDNEDVFVIVKKE